MPALFVRKSARALLLSVCALALGLAFAPFLPGTDAEAKPAKRYAVRAPVKRAVSQAIASPNRSAFAAKPARPVAKSIARRPIARPVRPAAVAKAAPRPAAPRAQKLLAAARDLPKAAFRPPTPKLPAPAVRPKAPVQRAVVVLPKPKFVPKFVPRAKPAVVLALPQPAPQKLAKPKTIVALALPKAQKASLKPQPTLAKPATLPAPADQRPFLLGQVGDWSAFRTVANGTASCFATTRPMDSAPKLPGRAPVFLYLTSTPVGDVKSEVTVRLGFAVAPDAKVTAMIDGRVHRLAASGELAYPTDAAGQRAFLEALRRGGKLILNTTTSRDGQAVTVTDAFSLSGLATMQRASEGACLLTARR